MKLLKPLAGLGLIFTALYVACWTVEILFNLLLSVPFVLVLFVCFVSIAILFTRLAVAE